MIRIYLRGMRKIEAQRLYHDILVAQQQLVADGLIYEGCRYNCLYRDYSEALDFLESELKNDDNWVKEVWHK